MSRSVVRGVKRVTKRLPVIKGLIEQRDTHLRHLQESTQVQISLMAERALLVNERNDLAKQCNALIEHRDALIEHRDALIEHRDALIEQRNLAAAERDAAYQRIEEVARELREALKARDAEILMRYGEDFPFVPNGHFYSPIVSQQELRQDAERIFCEWPRTLPDIDLREEAQLLLLEKFGDLYADLPFGDEPRDGLRYGYKNDAYSYSDAIFLNCMLRYAKPKRVVEIGSGHSSCMLIDTNERWFGNSIECTFIEPYPQLLHSLLRPGDRERIEVLPNRLQDVDLTVFSALQENDVLFIDSTHVSKTGSDVNRLFFEVLPALANGVYIHVHDIFYPFEYPRNWAEQGRGWNEIYLLRALLQNNKQFEIVAFNTFLQKFHKDFFEAKMPLCLKNKGGSIWLRKGDLC